MRKANANPKKIYCIDHALVSSVSSGILVNTGHELENLVCVALRHHYQSIFYYRTNSGREVDFLAQKLASKRFLVQVCESMKNEGTKKREVRALQEAMDELGLSSGTIVTRNEEEIIVLGSKTISVVPAWKFLLQKFDD